MANSATLTGFPELRATSNVPVMSAVPLVTARLPIPSKVRATSISGELKLACAWKLFNVSRKPSAAEPAAVSAISWPKSICRTKSRSSNRARSRGMDPSSGIAESPNTMSKVEVALRLKLNARSNTALVKLISNSGLSNAGSTPSSSPRASSRSSSKTSRSAALVTPPNAELKAPKRSNPTPSVGSPRSSLMLLLTSGRGSFNALLTVLSISATSSAASSKASMANSTGSITPSCTPRRADAGLLNAKPVEMRPVPGSVPVIASMIWRWEKESWTRPT